MTYLNDNHNNNHNYVHICETRLLWRFIKDNCISRLFHTCTSTSVFIITFRGFFCMYPSVILIFVSLWLCDAIYILWLWQFPFHSKILLPLRFCRVVPFQIHNIYSIFQSELEKKCPEVKWLWSWWWWWWWRCKQREIFFINIGMLLEHVKTCAIKGGNFHHFLNDNKKHLKVL